MVTRQALDGIVVIDFSWALAGPWLTKNLAEHGATVIKIESSTRLDVNRRTPPYKDGVPGINRSVHFTYGNNDKYGMTLNLKSPEGIRIAKRLISMGDVLVENFTPGAMKRLGLDYGEVSRINPRIIMISLSMQGQTGPHSGYRGFAWLLQALTGSQLLCGFPHRPPVSPGPFLPDYIGAYSGLLALGAALACRTRTGKGLYIDLSQFEAGAYLLAPFLLDSTVNRREARAMANRHPAAAPHGVYRCKGDDRWCAIGIFTDKEWQAFQKVAGTLGWAQDSRFGTAIGRKQNEDELERLVEAWCLSYTPEQIMVTLQGEGVAAGVVQSTRDLWWDPQLKLRGHYQELDHLEMGSHVYEAPGFKLSRTPGQLRRAAPILGQHNEYICKEFLGMSEKEYVELLLAGVFE